MGRFLNILFFAQRESEARQIVADLNERGVQAEFDIVTSAERFAAALDQLRWDVVLCSHELPAIDARRALALMFAADPDLPMLIIATMEEELAVALMQAGARDVIRNTSCARLAAAVAREADARQLRTHLTRDAGSSRQRFRNIAMQSMQGIVIRNSGGTVFVNEAFCRMFGYSADELTVKPPAELYHPDDQEKLLELSQSRETGDGGSHRYELRGLRKDGTVFWLEHLTCSVEWNGERATQVLAIDISERKDAERRLASQEQKYREIFEHAPVAMYRTGSDRRFIETNQAFHELLGYGPEELIAKRPRDLIPAAEAEMIAPMFLELWSGQRHRLDVEHQMIRRDGSLVWVHLSASLAVGVEHEGVTLVAHVRDISDLRKGHAALADREKKYREAFENAPMSMLRISHSRVIMDANPAFEKMLGYTRAELEGVVPHALIHAEDKELVRARAVDIWSGKLDQIENEYRLIRKDGKTIRVLAWSRLVADDSGKTNHLLVQMQDVTERHVAEQRLAQQEAKYRETFENAPEAIFWFTRGKIVEANRAFCELIGYSQQELVRMSPGNFMIAEEQSKNRLVMNDLWARHTDRLDLEHRVVRKDGSVAWVRTWTSLAFDSNGEPWLAVCHVQDITAQREAGEALEQREKLYRHLVEESLQGVAIAAVGGKPLFVNEVFAKMYGYSIDEILAIDSTIKLYHPGEWPRLKSYIAGREAGDEEVRRYEIRSVRKDGTVFWTEQMSSSVQWNGQRATQVVSIDITERKIAETALKEREQRYRSLVDNSLQGILVAREKVQFANTALCRMFGYTAEELVALPSVFDCYHPDDHERVREAAQARQRDDETARTLEFRGVRKDGSTFWIQQMSSLIEWQGETAAQIVMIDITERKNAEQRLAESERQYRETFENAPVAMAWVSNEDDFLVTNRAFQDLLGYTKEELSRMKRRDVVHAKFAEKRERDMNDLIENRIDREVSEVRLVRKDKSLLWALVSTCVIRDEHGNSRFIIGHLQDITAHKAAEEQLFQAQKMDALGNLAGGIAHDFNNMLLPIIAMTELAKGEIALDSPVQENLSMVLEAATQASHLVKQILTFSRQDERELSDIEISSCVSETLKLMRNVLPSSITVIDRVDSEVGVIVGDRAQLQSVMMNLASNAVDAMDGKVGTLTVALNRIVADHQLAGRRGALEEGQSYAKITIEDSGCGMDQKTVEKIFNPFFTTKPVGEGTGLGLAMVHGIVESFKGATEVSSEIGVGTVFDIYLPLAPADATVETSNAGEVVLTA